MEYLHGGDVYRNQVKYDFSVNINPLGMPKGCAEAVRRGLSLCARYPDWRGEALCGALAEKEQVAENRILLGNGAAELIYALCFAVRPRKALILSPTFQEYEAAVTAAGGGCSCFSLREEEGFLLGGETAEQFIEQINEKVDLVFLCTPNNPTGGVIRKEILLRIAQRCEAAGSWLCVDECFLPFLEGESGLTLKRELERLPHLLVLRAFTKIYGMPGLRLGYAMTANEGLLAAVRSCIQPWNTSVLAQLAGLQALKEKNFVQRTAELVKKEREYLTQGLSGLSPEIIQRVYRSEANFILFRGREDLKEVLLKQGILIRDCSNFKGLGKGFFRIAVRDRRENEALLEAMKGSED